MSIKGPAIFLAQFAGDEAPLNNLENISKWASDLGYIGVQIPSWDARLFDLKTASESKDYCDEIKGTLKKYDLELTELSTHLQGQLVAVHPAYDIPFDGFAAEGVRGNPKARQEWAIDQMKKAALASKNLELTAHATFLLVSILSLSVLHPVQGFLLCLLFLRRVYVLQISRCLAFF